MRVECAPRATVVRLQGLVPAVAGDAPRVAPARLHDLGPLARIVSGIAARISSGEPPRLVTTLGRHPSLFRAWLRYSAHLMPFGALPRRDTELVILRVAWQCRSAYEWQQHVPIALRVGLTPDEVAGVADDPPAGGLTARQQALLAASDELLASSRLSDETWAAVQRELDTESAIELCMLVGQYQGLGTALGGLGVPVERSA